MTLLSTEYTLVLDTDQIAFPFSRELCAYCTGFTDEQDRGIYFSDIFYSDAGIAGSEKVFKEELNPYKDAIALRHDDGWDLSPSCVLLNKNYGCNLSGDWGLITQDNCDRFESPAPTSVGIFFSREPTPGEMEAIRIRAEKFFGEILTETKVVLEGIRLLTHLKYGEEKELWKKDK